MSTRERIATAAAPARAAGSALADRAAQWWWLDLPLGVVLAVILHRTTEPGTGADLLGRLVRSERLSIYTDLIQVVSLFAGFGGVTFAVYLGMTSRGIARLRAKVGDSILRVWVATLILPWMGALALVVAKLLDRGANGGPWSWTIAYAAVLVTALQLSRAAWLFFQLASIEQSEEKPAAPTTQRTIRVMHRSG